MSKELSTAPILISEQVIDNILANLDKENHPKKELAKIFWMENRSVLVGLSTKVVSDIIQKSHNHEQLRIKWDEVVLTLSWEERNILLTNSLSDLKSINNQKIRELIFINNLIVTGIKILPLILSVI